MARSVPEWIGRTPDTAIPPRVKDRIFIAFNGRCAKCTRKIGAGFLDWDCDHIIALKNGGENRQSNLQPLCTEVCHKAKTAKDVAEKSTVYRKRIKLTLGVRSPSQKMHGAGFRKSPPQKSASRPIDRSRA